MSLHLVTVIVIVGVLAPVSTRALAQDQMPSCPALVIEGSIGSPAADGSNPERMASVYVHATGQPLADRQVIATFSDASGSPIGEPSILVTDDGGRAEVTVPALAESVNFVAEAPDGPGCTGEDNADPRVLLEVVPVGAPNADLPDGPPVVDDPSDELAETGPVTDFIVLSSLLLLACGAAVGTGRGRRRALSTQSHGVKSGIGR